MCMCVCVGSRRQDHHERAAGHEIMARMRGVECGGGRDEISGDDVISEVKTTAIHRQVYKTTPPPALN